MKHAMARTTALIAAVAIAVTLGSSPAVAASAPTPTPLASPEPTPTPPEASPSPAPTAAVSDTPAQPLEMSTPALTGNDARAGDVAPAEAAVTALPSVFIQLPGAYPIARLNASKNSVPLDPDTEPHAVLSIDDPLSAANNMSNVSLEEIKGRGNFTFTLEKKPYQIKFDTSTSVLGMAKAKTWILLANHADPSLMRNKVALDLASELGVLGSVDSRFVDLTVNGEYLGNYLLTEKVEVKTNRLELQNPSGILLELDNLYGAAEDHHFRTSLSRSTYALKDAVGDVEIPLRGEVAQAYSEIQTHIADFESALYSTEPDWSLISSMIDVQSFIKYYFVQEIASNGDVSQSSVYVWKDGPDDVLHAGPAWDFDVALGNYAFEALGGDFAQDYVKNASFLRAAGGNDWYTQLFRNEEFTVAVNNLFESEIKSKVALLPARIDAHIGALSASASANFVRWPGVLAGVPVFSSGRAIADTWLGEATQLREWVNSRVSHVSRAYGANMPVLRYASHVSAVGWQPTLTAGLIAGTVGRGLQLEAFEISMANQIMGGELQSRAHIQGIGWTQWQGGDTRIGTTGLGLQIEAVQFRLTGGLAEHYDVSYRVHAQALGWLEWTSNGRAAGTSGRGLQLEAAQIRLLERDDPPTTTPGAAWLEYSAHVAGLGWTSPVASSAAGTTGQGLAMQALTASLSSDRHAGGLEYRAHVQGRGWLGWQSSPEVIGTTGLGLKMEAVELRLTGDLARYYRVRYQAHVQGVGWQEWTVDGQTAGTTGRGLQMEALTIELVPGAR